MVKKLPEPANIEEAEKYIDYLEGQFALSLNALFVWEAARIAYEFELPTPVFGMMYFGNQAREVFEAIEGKQTMDRALLLANRDTRRVQYEQLIDPNDKKRALWSRRSLLRMVDEFDPEETKSAKAIIEYLTDTLAPNQHRWMTDWYQRARKGCQRTGQVGFQEFPE